MINLFPFTNFSPQPDPEFLEEPMGLVWRRKRQWKIVEKSSSDLSFSFLHALFRSRYDDKKPGSQTPVGILVFVIQVLREQTVSVA